ncbi:hypothetical protein TEA_027029 [Camellia sinensis var. sinensis]|uniref:Uncharacterized protein n=1 Tax=Camellia sinensis var. sinensis TaxID=542762 RepID=A0A4S4F0T8_CAMSN|nr:hypothetical protein TEA_027029 [Camellia sinensis var. sinensis]
MILYLPADHGEEYGTSEMDFWEELPCGVYSMRVGASKLDANMVGEVKRHEWADPILNELIKWERTSVQPKPKELNVSRMKFPGWQHDMLSVHSTKDVIGSLTAVLVLIVIGLIQASVLVPSETVLLALREAVMRRTTISTMFKCFSENDVHNNVENAEMQAKNRGECLDAVETE